MIESRDTKVSAATATVNKKVPAAVCNCTALRKATRRVSQLYDSVLEPCGLKTTQRAILNHIVRSDKPSVGELAAYLVMDRGALTHNLKPLERDGLVEIKVDQEDRRNRLVIITPKGRKRLAESEPLWEQAQRRFDSAFGAVNSSSLRQALGIIVSAEFLGAFELPE
jgi:DNA-binding MarR family transcriptional regulator